MIAVEMIWVVDDPGMMEPTDGPAVSVQGTTIVVWRIIVVTGAV